MIEYKRKNSLNDEKLLRVGLLSPSDWPATKIFRNFAVSPIACGTAHRPAADVRYWLTCEIIVILTVSPIACGTAHRPAADVRYWLSREIL